MAECGASEEVRIVEDLSRKLAVASRFAVKKLSLDEEIWLKQANEMLGLVSKLKKAEEEVRTLTNLSSLLKEENTLLKGKK